MAETRVIHEGSPGYFYAGQIIRSKSSRQIFKIVKANPKWLISVAEDGRSWRIPRSNAEPAPVGTVFNETALEAPELVLGMAVRFKTPGKPDQRGVFIVADKKEGGLRLVRLGGGMGMRYYYNIQPHNLVSVEEINSQSWD